MLWVISSICAYACESFITTAPPQHWISITTMPLLLPPAPPLQLPPLNGHHYSEHALHELGPLVTNGSTSFLCFPSFLLEPKTLQQATHGWIMWPLWCIVNYPSDSFNSRFSSSPKWVCTEIMVLATYISQLLSLWFKTSNSKIIIIK